MMGELSYFLELQIKQLPTGDFINQEKYSKELLNKFGMSNSKSSSTPMSTSMQISADEAGKSVDQSLYRKLIGSLLYLTASRPDIQFAVGVCARYQVKPKESHFTTAKRILKYVKGTVDAGLWYPKEGGFDLVGYSDTDLGGCKLDRKSPSGTCHFLQLSRNTTSLEVAACRFCGCNSNCQIMELAPKRRQTCAIVRVQLQ
ncbi:hypothetical protein OROMI_019108 [Orobanche minor]